MNIFMEFFLFFLSILQFLFPFAFKDAEVPVQTTEPVVEETVVPDDHVHTGGNGNCLQSAVCEICGGIYGGRGEHVYAETVTPATCTEGGYTTYVCRFCLQSKVDDYTEATGHTYEKTSAKATCVFAGYDYYSCINCVDSYTEETEPAKGHIYEDEYFSANCIEGYRVVHKCKTCKSSYSEEFSGALGHEYTEIITAPTCQRGGYTTFKCIRCSYSYTGAETGTVNHTYSNYVPYTSATCTSTGTKIAYCDYDCGEVNTIPGDEELLPHVDNDKDTICDADGCTAKVYIDFSYLQYAEGAVANVAVDTFISKADKRDGDAYVLNAGVDYNGIIESPYFTAKITGRVDGNTAVTTQNIPVYGTVVYVGETGKGALHSFSEIYITEGEYDTFTIEIDSKSLNITNAVILPESSGERATVSNGKVTAVLSGFGTHTFIFNNENQQYAYTVHVRAQVDDNLAIEQLKAANPQATIVVIDGYHTISDLNQLLYGSRFNNTVYSIIEFYTTNKIIYLKKGAYIVADHKFDINNSTQDSETLEEFVLDGTYLTGENLTGLGGQKRTGVININNGNNVQILGYGAIDLSRLDRGERRGAIISWSSNIRIQGLKFINSPQWTNVLYRCNEVYFRDVDVYGYRQNSDAFDICNSNNVYFDGCFARTGDDAFVVKTLDGDENATSNNVNIENCYAWVGKARAFGIFGETYLDISNVTFRNNTVLYHDATWDYLRIPAIGIVVEGDEQNTTLAQKNSNTTLTNITFENIEICRNKAAALNTIIFKLVQNYRINGLTFKNISSQTPANSSAISTINTFSETSTIELNVVIENIVCGGTKVTDQNYTSYFNFDAKHYCTSFK